MFIGDDFITTARFWLSYGFEYAVLIESTKERKAFAFPDLTPTTGILFGSLAHVIKKYLHERFQAGTISCHTRTIRVLATQAAARTSIAFPSPR